MIVLTKLHNENLRRIKVVYILTLYKNIAEVIFCFFVKKEYFMKTVVCLLRGINVGGNNQIDMKTLKHKLEDKGLVNVKTYINSGNIIFDSPSIELEQMIHDTIMEVFHLDINVLILDKETFISIASKIPLHYENNQLLKADCMFYLKGVTKQMVDEMKIQLELMSLSLWNMHLSHLSLSQTTTKANSIKSLVYPFINI